MVKDSLANAWQAIGIDGPVAVVASLTCSYLLIIALMPLFQRYALALPNARSAHVAPTPQGGGIAVVVAALGVSMAVICMSESFGVPAHTEILLVSVAAVFLAIVGGADDICELGIVPRLLAQATGILLVIVALPDNFRVLPFLPDWVERGLVLGASLWFVNLVNFMDGIDWMMVAEVVPLTAGIVIIGALGALPPVALVVALALNGAMLGFAPFNRPVARLFLGDMGSLPIGLLLAWLLLHVAGAGYLAAAILLPLYFVADATITLGRRLIAGDRIWQAHRTHFYQRAHAGGMRSMEVVMRVFFVNCGLVVLAILSVVLSTTAADIGVLVLGMALVTWLVVCFARGGTQ